VRHPSGESSSHQHAPIEEGGEIEVKVCSEAKVGVLCLREVLFEWYVGYMDLSQVMMRSRGGIRGGMKRRKRPLRL
jgi:hypothetical protein